jgi:hypothetical protein
MKKPFILLIFLPTLCFGQVPTSSTFTDIAANVLIWVIVFGIIWLAVRNSNQKQKRKQEAIAAHNAERERLEQAYRHAMTSGDKAAALQAGRAHFSFIRNGNLTNYDEQALTNDLSIMK